MYLLVNIIFKQIPPLSPPQRLRKKGREKERENRTRGGSRREKRKRNFHFHSLSQRVPRAHRSLSQSSNIFIALDWSPPPPPPPLQNPRNFCKEERSHDSPNTTAHQIKWLARGEGRSGEWGWGGRHDKLASRCTNCFFFLFK